MASIVGLVDSIKVTVLALAPSISVSLIVLGAIVYGVAHTQPAENRGRWQTLAMGMMIGGIIIAAIWGAADAIFKTSATLLT
ncbi:Uncharacterised protein [uncultured archaeon]|nr:Uncharacterised protein [uncultured archaeon]